MAKLYGEIAAKSLLTLDKSFARANGQPLDASEVYYSLQAAKDYAATAQAYIGQKIVVVENNVITHYSIEDESGTLKELGSKPIGDGDTISIAEDGTISLAAIPEDAATKTYNAVLVNGKLVWQAPSATTVEGLDTRLQSLESEVGDPATETANATGLYLAIAESIQEAKDYTDNSIVYYDYTLSYDSEKHQINLVDGMEVVSSIDATPFIKDGMLHDVDYNPENNTLTFTWNTDSGEKTDTVVLSDILDPVTYVAGDGIDISDDNTISVKVDDTSEDYISVSANGVKVSGIDTAIESAINTHSTAADGKYATKDELKTTDDKAESNATAITNLTGRIDDIVAEGGEPNQINNIKVNNVVQPIAEDKSVNITVPTKASDLTDYNDIDTRITAAQTQADKGVNDAASAMSKATEAMTAASNNANAISELNTTVGGHTTSISDHLTRIVNLEQADIAHATEYSTLNNIVSGHTETIAKKADITELDKTNAKASANETAITTLNDTTIPAINEAIGKKANSTEVYTKTEIGTITEGKTLVQMIEDAKTSATYDDTEIKASIKTNTDAIAILNGDVSTTGSVAKIATDAAKSEVANLVGEAPEALDTLEEIAKWIAEDDTGTTALVNRVGANETAIAAINNETTGIFALAKKYTDDSITNIPVATAEVLGLVKFDNSTIMMNENNQLYVNQINVNQLVQTTGEELILNGGSAK